MAAVTESDRKSPLPVDEDPNTLVSRIVAADPIPWYKKPNLRMLYIIFLPTVLGVEMTSGFDSSMMNGLQAVESWDLFFNKPRGPLLGLMGAIYSLGAICAVPFVAFITDTWGRRFAILFGSIIMVIGATLQTAAQNFAMFVISRFIMGIGIVFAIVAASSLIGELSYPKERARMGSLFNACWFIGAIAAAGTTLGTFRMSSTWGWRIPSVLQAFPSVLQIAFVYFLPESPRWLISKGRSEEAFDILAKYHAEGDRESELVKAEFVQIETTLKLEQETQKVGWRALLKTPGMRRRLLIGSVLGLFTQWSGNGLTSYYLARILENVGIEDNYTKNVVNLANTCWGFINATALALTVTKFPRRKAYLIGTSSLLVVFTAWTIASARYNITGDKSSSAAVIAMIFLYSPCYNIAYNALTYTYLVEVFPFHSRAKGIAIFQTFSRCAGFFNQFVNPIGLKNAGWKFYISYCVFLAFEVVFVFFMFPETHGKTLEELAFLFEKDEVQKQADIVEKAMHADTHELVHGDEESPRGSTAKAH
ncbi:hexose transporter [Coprinopsis sp. MPI-PUGE-AT-0042]|nr:hexose transporter [Coprinopsis sp. MPI-PUGE-AT-0042]